MSSMASRYRRLLVFLCALTVHAAVGSADEWPELPDVDAAVEIPAQAWPRRPGSRSVRVRVHYPDGQLTSVNAQTGLMLTLHNWGGVDCVGTADPVQLARELNVVAIFVNYLQSGQEHIDQPYDFGYLQALDALRALWYVERQLQQRQLAYAAGRVYATGGSGGGNVSLMAAKLAPRTFAVIIDMCGMTRLTDNIAYGLPGGPDLDARYSADPARPDYLSLDEQELRFVGHPGHLEQMRAAGTCSKIIVVHGVEDPTYADALEMVEWMRVGGIDVEPQWITAERVDGKIFTTTGHALGDRTQIVFEVAGKYLRPGSEQLRVRTGPSDFERGETLRYATSGGAFEVSYERGYPVGRFVPHAPLPEYPDHTDLGYVIDTNNQRRRIVSVGDWQRRREHILRHFQRAAGSLPSDLQRSALDVRVLEEVQIGELVRRKISYQSDERTRVPAYVFVPPLRSGQRVGAVLCLQQTTEVGKDEPAGVRGDATMKYALELAERGWVTIAPDYPSFGDYDYDFSNQDSYVSGTMKAIWDNRRAVDVLERMSEVDRQRIGCIGHSLGGHNAIFTALLEPRIGAVVTSCGFTSFERDDLPSWTGPRYMPRLASEFQSDRALVPFDFHELLAALAPRPVFVSAATGDTDFDVAGVRDVLAAARSIYKLYGNADALQAHYPDAPHSFPDESRQAAYKFLEQNLLRREEP